QVRFNQQTSADRIRQELAPMSLGEITVQDFGKAGREYLVRFEKVNNIGGLAKRLEGALNTDPSNKAEVVRVESVGAKVGSDLRRRGFLAVGAATLFMGVFIAIQFRNISWSFGTGAVIALIHDVLVVSGALVISRLEFDLTSLAALL